MNRLEPWDGARSRWRGAMGGERWWNICNTLNKRDFKNKFENIEMKRVKISEQ